LKIYEVFILTHLPRCIQLVHTCSRLCWWYCVHTGSSGAGGSAEIWQLGQSDCPALQWLEICWTGVDCWTYSKRVCIFHWFTELAELFALPNFDVVGWVFNQLLEFFEVYLESLQKKNWLFKRSANVVSVCIDHLFVVIIAVLGRGTSLNIAWVTDRVCVRFRNRDIVHPWLWQRIAMADQSTKFS